MTIFKNVEAMIGNTPLLYMPIKSSKCKFYMKLEKFNPGQSIKDRAAKHMLLQAEREGLIRPGDTIIESSSGNTGISLAMLAASRNYRFICVVDNHVPKEKIEILEAYGTTIEYVGKDLPPDYHAAKERVEKIKELCETMPNAFFINQGDNLNNREAHYLYTAEEILAELGPIDYLFVSVGTGGSISGVGRKLKESNPNTRIIAIEPAGSIIFNKPYKPFFQSGSGSARLIFKNIDFSIVDEDYQVTDAQAFNTCRYLARSKGVLVGGSGGSVIYKSIEYLSKLPLVDGTAVAIVPDGGERYISTIFNDHWMSKHNLIDEDINSFLLRYIG